MQWKSSLYLTGGLCYALGSALFIACVMLTPATTDPAVLANSIVWKGTIVGFMFSAALTIAGALVLQRHFAGTDSDGLAIVALTLAVVGAMGYLSPSTDWAMLAAGRIAAWSSFIPMGLALSRESRLPKWLGASGIILGAAEVAADVFMDGSQKQIQYVWLLGFAYMFVVGLCLVQARNALSSAPANERVAVNV